MENEIGFEKKLPNFNLSNIMVFMILVLPFLRYYNVPLIGMGFTSFFTIILLACCFMIWAVNPKRKNCLALQKSKKWYVLFFIWLVIVTVCYELFTEVNINNSMANYNMMGLLMPAFIAIVIFFILSGYFNTNACIKIYSWLVVFSTIIYLFQWILYLFGWRISFKLPFEFSSGWEGLEQRVYFGMTPYPTSLFSERSHFCEFLVPYVAICLFGDKIILKSRIKKAVFYSIIILSTVSGNGVIVLLIEWLLFFLVYAKFKKPINKFFVAILGIVALIGSYFLLNSIPIFEKMFDRLFFNNTGTSYVGSKADYRIYRGFDLFFKLPFECQLSGVGYKHMYLFSKMHNIVSIYDRSWESYEYFSAISQVMIYGGLVGAVSFFMHLGVLFKPKNNAVRGIIIIFLALCFSTEILFNCMHILYMLLIISVMQETKEK